MIYKAQVLIRTPGERWAAGMQAKRDEFAQTVKLINPDPEQVAEFIEANLSCGGRLGPRAVAISSLDRKVIDDGSGLEYEFVTYDSIRRVVIMAVFVGDGSVGSPIRFNNLFPAMRRGAVGEDDRGFLIVSLIRGSAKDGPSSPLDETATTSAASTLRQGIFERY